MGGGGGGRTAREEGEGERGSDFYSVLFLSCYMLFGPEKFKGCSHSSGCCTGWSCGCGIDRISDWSFPQPKAELIRSSVLATGLSCAHDIMRNYLCNILLC